MTKSCANISGISDGAMMTFFVTETMDMWAEAIPSFWLDVKEGPGPWT